MSHLSYWEKSIYFNDVDIVIIGAGIVGLCTGISLLEKDPTLRVLILERNYLPLGASTKNAGFACFGSPSELLEDLEHHNEEKVFSLFKRRFDGIQKLIQYTHSFPIEFEHIGGYELQHANRSKFLYEEQDLNYLNKHIQEYTGLKNFFYFEDEKLASFQLFGFKNLVANKYEASLHPVKMILALQSIYQSKGGKILFGAELKSWHEEEKYVKLELSDSTKFQTRKIIFCVNGFAKKYFPDIEVKAARNMVLLIQTQSKIKLKGCFHMDRGYIYFRNVEDYLLIGGARNVDLENEYTEQFGFNETIQSYLMSFVKECILPNQEIEIKEQWSGILGLGHEKKPIIKMVSDHTAVAVRMGGMGIAIGSLVGEEAADILYQNLQLLR
ncbi:MAG: FAD-binding oxidoreductase [Saprospiraceae bacterium]|nr:FAD-binding oxidoreductase [Saprospiraceae bacterium]